MRRWNYNSNHTWGGCTYLHATERRLHQGTLDCLGGHMWWFCHLPCCQYQLHDSCRQQMQEGQHSWRVHGVQGTLQCTQCTG